MTDINEQSKFTVQVPYVGRLSHCLLFGGHMAGATASPIKESILSKSSPKSNIGGINRESFQAPLYQTMTSHESARYSLNNELGYWSISTKAPWPASRPVDPNASIQHSRVIAGAVWPPLHYLPSLNLIEEANHSFESKLGGVIETNTMDQDENETVSDSNSIPADLSPISAASSLNNLNPSAAQSQQTEEELKTLPTKIEDDIGEPTISAS
ncbi:hypothetical protein F5050DRAFT_1905001 [Lentinula boryana]|uniref:Uncharacterized protein n=1 Tax=Lentinula boryana TaxID=40481 RepID=A0ABQ8Q4Z2_9AGAR|nr:hypothetical protein F5050DRAFT_1905001 [Lentinula boryana]